MTNRIYGATCGFECMNLAVGFFYYWCCAVMIMADETFTQLEHLTIILENKKIKPNSLLKPMAQEHAWWESDKKDRTGTGNFFWAIMSREASPWEPRNKEGYKHLCWRSAWQCPDSILGIGLKGDKRHIYCLEILLDPLRLLHC